jgi:hypothetical protein
VRDLADYDRAFGVDFTAACTDGEPAHPGVCGTAGRPTVGGVTRNTSPRHSAANHPPAAYLTFGSLHPANLTLEPGGLSKGDSPVLTRLGNLVLKVSGIEAFNRSFHGPARQ